ncbi:hypothetical protein HanHA300_Chr16g0605231 [Helianthus annuus]|uniref:Uncharacterized protein n=2 Tax=Helianthus annuus TaxID=4232 RepID=A0A251T8S1_HELAN|nr:hypothetical protein HanHA300_Chr16g0605231 [Helianthus annuus]KAJ0460019.1 hypothetical protein HanHA89_Chr16g0655761 [Helianthus annuus]
MMFAYIPVFMIIYIHLFGEAVDDDLSDNFIVKTCQRCIPVTCNNEAGEFMEAGMCDWCELGSFLWLFLLSLGLVVFQSGSFQVSFGAVCFEPGSFPDKCVTWARGLVDEEDDQFLVHSFIAPVFSMGHHQVEFLTCEYRTHHLGMATISYLSLHMLFDFLYEFDLLSLLKPSSRPFYGSLLVS